MPSTQTRPDSTTGADHPGTQLALVWVHPEVSLTLVDRPLLSIGREEAADLQLSGNRVSRLHARIARKGPLLLLADADSRNGVFLNGERIEDAPLSDNDVLRVGDHVAVVVRLSSDWAPAAAVFDEPLEGTLIGPRSRSTWNKLVQLAPSRLPVILHGPTGSGKEIYARALHALSGRQGEFVALNCAAIPTGLAESQLFGRSRGAFTGALRSAPGLFEAAHEGTLLLDEVVDLDLSLQAKLLRTLEESTVTRVGETSPRPVNFRLIAASQTSLLELANTGGFRHDLLSRIAGATLQLLPLCERREEIFVLFKSFFIKAGGNPDLLSPSFCEAVCLDAWPLNARQLRQVAAHAALAFSNVRLRREHLATLVSEVYGDVKPRSMTAASEASRHSLVAKLGRRRALWFERHQHELEALLAALQDNGGNITDAAKIAGISRQRAGRLLATRSSLTTGAAE